jgi:hypothetical protein
MRKNKKHKVQSKNENRRKNIRKNHGKRKNIEVTSIQKTKEKKSNKSHGNPTGKKKRLTKTIKDEQNSDKNNVESK